MDTIYGTSVKGIGEDKMSWKPDRTKGFMVNAYYCLLVGSNGLCFPWKSIWKKDPLLSGFLCLDCSLGEMYDN